MDRLLARGCLLESQLRRLRSGSSGCNGTLCLGKSSRLNSGGGSFRLCGGVDGVQTGTSSFSHCVEHGERPGKTWANSCTQGN